MIFDISTVMSFGWLCTAFIPNFYKVKVRICWCISSVHKLINIFQLLYAQKYAQPIQYCENDTMKIQDSPGF